MDQVLMNYLPNAFAFIYVIDISHAGGVQQDLKVKVSLEIEFEKKVTQSCPIYRGFLCIISTCSKTHIPFRKKLSTSSEVPQNHNNLPSTRLQALPP